MSVERHEPVVTVRAEFPFHGSSPRAENRGCGDSSPAGVDGSRRIPRTIPSRTAPAIRPRNPILPVIAAALFSLAACSAGDDSQRDGNASAERAETAAFVVGADEETDTVRTELYHAPADFPVRFSTYVPEDMHAETASSNGGEAVRFVPVGDAVRDRNAYVNVFVHPEGSTTRDAEAFAEAFAASAGIPVGGGEKPPQPDFPQRYSWSIAEFDFDTWTREGERVLGTIAVGEHDGRAFHVVLQYPAELDGHFLPRAQLIGEELRWHGEVDTS